MADTPIDARTFDWTMYRFHEIDEDDLFWLNKEYGSELNPVHRKIDETKALNKKQKKIDKKEDKILDKEEQILEEQKKPLSRQSSFSLEPEPEPEPELDKIV